jgi:hypothetical protein
MSNCNNIDNFLIKTNEEAKLIKDECLDGLAMQMNENIKDYALNISFVKLNTDDCPDG